MNAINSNDLQRILTRTINQMKEETGDSFDIKQINLAELERRTKISRSKLRTLKKNDFIVTPHGRKGLKAKETVLTGFTPALDDLLKKNVTNSSVCYERLQVIGYEGGLTQIKEYILSHQDLIPPKRLIVSPQGNRGRRYRTGTGEAYQMDWGFVEVESDSGSTYRAACFAMICHHCGMRYVEFFPNAKQENLFIGMIHAFLYMGVPKHILTDNMKSVVIGRDVDGHPIWQKDYESFMKLVGFETRLCKPRHPFTKGAVERLVQFVKQNFMIGRTFGNITDLNCDALQWCNNQNNVYHRAVDCIPAEKHGSDCMKIASVLTIQKELGCYLFPERLISFDGFVNYEGRRFGVPYWYGKKACRIGREGFYVTIYSDDMTKVLAKHEATWSRRDSFCHDQYTSEQPEELPTAPIKTLIHQQEPPAEDARFMKFDFGKDIWND